MHTFDLIKAGMHRCADRHSLKVMLQGWRIKHAPRSTIVVFFPTLKKKKKGIVLNVVHRSDRFGVANFSPQSKSNTGRKIINLLKHF